MEKERKNALEMAKEKKEAHEEKEQEESRRDLMIHLLIAFLLLCFMSLMVIEQSITIRLAYFFVCVILFSVYNIVHLAGIKTSLDMLTRNKKKHI